MDRYTLLIDVGTRVLSAMGYPATGRIVTYEPIAITIVSFSTEPNLPQQFASEVVLALQQVLRCVDDRLHLKPTDDHLSEKNNQVLIDINNHFLDRFTEIEQKAKMLADRAVAFRTNIRMDPLSPLERKIVHSVVDRIPGLSTESFGVGYDRHVVIKWSPVVE